MRQMIAVLDAENCCLLCVNSNCSAVPQTTNCMKYVILQACAVCLS